MTISLDGCIGGEEDDTSTNTSENVPNDDHQYANDFFAAADTVVFGRTTFEGFTEYWDNVDLNDTSIPAVEKEFAKIFKGLHRVVFSRTLTHGDRNTTIINDDIGNRIQQIKQQPGRDMVLVCGPELLSSLVECNVIDELQLIVQPKAVGKGKSLFAQLRKPLRLNRLLTREFQAGGVLHHYSVISPI